MHLSQIQELKRRFDKERHWHKFPASLVYVHLTEELGEIGRQILFEEGYKVKGLGHELEGDLGREFGQAFSLFLQLANQLGVDLEKEFLEEMPIMEKRFDKAKWRSYVKLYKPRNSAR